MNIINKVDIDSIYNPNHLDKCFTLVQSSPNSRYVHLLTTIDCLTVRKYKIKTIPRSKFTKYVVCGFDEDTIPENMCVCTSQSLEEIFRSLMRNKVNIISDLGFYTIIDVMDIYIIDMDNKGVVCRIMLESGVIDRRMGLLSKPIFEVHHIEIEHPLYTSNFWGCVSFIENATTIYLRSDRKFGFIPEKLYIKMEGTI